MNKCYQSLCDLGHLKRKSLPSTPLPNSNTCTHSTGIIQFRVAKNITVGMRDGAIQVGGGKITESSKSVYAFLQTIFLT